MCPALQIMQANFANEILWMKITQLGHTKLKLCFMDYLTSQGDPAGRKNKNKKFTMK